MYVVEMLNDAGEWETSVKKFRYIHTAIAWVMRGKLRSIYADVRYTKIG